MQVAGRNFLLPVDAALLREADLRYEAFELQAVLDEMDAPGRTNVIFLDACRDNPLRDAYSRRLGSRGMTVGQGLAPVETRSGGILIAYATAPGSVAMDGDGTNSPFTTALARHIAAPGLEVRQMLTRVLADVQTATGSKQRPWVNESLDSDFYFVSKPDKPAADAAVSPEIVFWQTIAGSTNPADFAAYIKQFPQGSFVTLASARVAALSARAAPDENHAIAESLATMLRAGMTVISRGQEAINNPFLGAKGLDGQTVLGQTIKLYRDVTGRDPQDMPATSRPGKLLRDQMDAIVAVMDANQDKINARGTGFKGFIPALFARLVNEEFGRRALGAAVVKITAPPDLIRNPKARPDDWEESVIAAKFLSGDWPPGQSFDATNGDLTTGASGGQVFRMMMPQYYAQSCLACHGGPRGQLDITGYPKEGGTAGQLGAVISIQLRQ
jgi:hypothetical protein